MAPAARRLRRRWRRQRRRAAMLVRLVAPLSRPPISGSSNSPRSSRWSEPSMERFTTRSEERCDMCVRSGALRSECEAEEARKAGFVDVSQCDRCDFSRCFADRYVEHWYCETCYENLCPECRGENQITQCNDDCQKFTCADCSGPCEKCGYQVCDKCQRECSACGEDRCIDCTTCCQWCDDVCDPICSDLTTTNDEATHAAKLFGNKGKLSKAARYCEECCEAHCGDCVYFAITMNGTKSFEPRVCLSCGVFVCTECRGPTTPRILVCDCGVTLCSTCHLADVWLGRTLGRNHQHDLEGRVIALALARRDLAPAAA